jgi:hypothetical protein
MAYGKLVIVRPLASYPTVKDVSEALLSAQKNRLHMFYALRNTYRQQLYMTMSKKEKDRWKGKTFQSIIMERVL